MSTEALTKAQETILKRLGAGEILTFSSGPRDAGYWFVGDDGRAPHPASVAILNRAGLTRQVRDGAPLTVGLYRIELTPAGRAALATKENSNAVD